MGLALGLAHLARAASPESATESPGNSRPSIEPLILCGKPSSRPAGTYSPGIAEIIKMLDAKVGAQVIEAYLENSPIHYEPETAELVVLKEHGASAEVLLALLHRADGSPTRRPGTQTADRALGATLPSDTAPDVVYPAYPYAYVDPEETPYPEVGYSYRYGWPVYWSGMPGWYSRPRWYGHSPYSPAGQRVVASGGQRGHPSALRSGGFQGSGRSAGHSR